MHIIKKSIDWGCLMLGAAVLSQPLQATFVQLLDPTRDTIPGTNQLANGHLFNGPALIGDEVVYGTSLFVDGQSRAFVFAVGKDGLRTLFDSATGFSGGEAATGSVFGFERSDDVVFWAAQKAASPQDGLVRGFDGAVFDVAFPQARAAINQGNGEHHYQLAGVSADGNVFAMTGYDSRFAHFVLRAEGSDVEVIAQESVTVAPGTTETFEELFAVALSPDGQRLLFSGRTANSQGLYLWDNGMLSKIASQTDLYPGTAKPFDALSVLAIRPRFAADGTLYLVMGTVRTLAGTGDHRLGLFAYTAEGNLDLLFDNTTVVEGTDVPIGTAMNGLQFHTDGSATLRAFDNANNLSHYLWFSDHELQLAFSFAGTHYGPNALSVDGTLYLLPYRFAGEFILELHRVDPVNRSTTRLHRFSPPYPSNYRPSSLFIHDGELFTVSAIQGFAPQIWQGSLVELDPGPDFPEAAYRLGTLPTNAPWYNVARLGWIWATDDYLPWVYSHDAQSWLYLTGNSMALFRAYSPRYGWLHVVRNHWPWAYAFEQEARWLYFGG